MIFVAAFAGFAPIGNLGSMTSIGTLFAFVIVCGGIIVMRRTQPNLPRPFKTPFVPVVPAIGVLLNLGLMLGLGVNTWIRLVVWLAIGLAIYFTYGRKHSTLQNPGSARN
jgi:APA family basic amino acid/polyamine antiporter